MASDGLGQSWCVLLGDRGSIRKRMKVLFKTKAENEFYCLWAENVLVCYCPSLVEGWIKILKVQFGCKRDLIPPLHTHASKDSNPIACPLSSSKGSAWSKILPPGSLCTVKMRNSHVPSSPLSSPTLLAPAAWTRNSPEAHQQMSIAQPDAGRFLFLTLIIYLSIHNSHKCPDLWFQINFEPVSQVSLWIRISACYRNSNKLLSLFKLILDSEMVLRQHRQKCSDLEEESLKHSTPKLHSGPFRWRLLLTSDFIFHHNLSDEHQEKVTNTSGLGRSSLRENI